MSDLSCKEFGSMISDYLDRSVKPGEVGRFARHALLCRTCRVLLEDIREKLTSVTASRIINLPPNRSGKHRRHGRHALDCNTFEENVSRYLEGFLPASEYHLFSSHASACARCAKILDQVVKSFNACHFGANNSEDPPASSSIKNLLLKKWISSLYSLSQRRRDGTGTDYEF